jgi:hypothetical protein
MKKSILILYLIPYILFSQEYVFINSYSNDAVFLRNNFEQIEDKYISYNFFKNNWSLMKSDDSDNAKVFLDNFNFAHAKAMINDSDSKINFSNLNNNFIEVKDVNKHLKNNDYYTVISKPIFNCAMDWVILYKCNVYKDDVGSTADIYIYRKVDGKWIYYHKINLWIS